MESKSWPWRADPTRMTGVNDSSRCHKSFDHSKGKAQLNCTTVETSPLFHVEHMSDEGQQMVNDLSLKIVDLSARIAVKEEELEEQARIAKAAMEDSVAMKEKLRRQTAAMKEAAEGREKAEGGYRTLKQEVEVLRQQKGAAEARALQMSVAAREGMEAARMAREQQAGQEQSMARAVEAARRKSKELEARLRSEAELSENAELRQQLMECAAENSAMSRSLAERAHSLADLAHHRALADTQVRLLQVRIETMEKDASASQYELHVLKKELLLSSDEKDLLKKSALSSQKQHLDHVKKIAKLESECQRLRALLRKKLPGPADVAQMRVESDHIGKKKLPSARSLPPSPVDHPQHAFSMAKEIEELNVRLASMDDETKLLKEALAKKSSEVHAARQLCARTASKLSSAEGLLETVVTRGRPSSPAVGQDSLAKSPENMPMPEVMDWAISSEEGGNNDDELSCAESWASALITELSHLKKDDASSPSVASNSPLQKLPPSPSTACKQLQLPAPSPLDAVDDSQVLRLALVEPGDDIQALNSALRALSEKLAAFMDNVPSMDPMHDQNLEMPELRELLGRVMEAMRSAQAVIENLHDSALAEIDTGFGGEGTSCKDMVTEVSSSPQARDSFKKVLQKVVTTLVSIEGPKGSVDQLEEGNAKLHMLVQELMQATEGDWQGSAEESEEEVVAILERLLNVLCCHLGSSGGTSDVSDNAEREMLTALRAELEGVKEGKEEAEGRLGASAAELEECSARAAELEAQLVQLSYARTCGQKELADMAALKAQVESDLRSARADVEAMQQRIVDLTSQLDMEARHSLELEGTVARLSESGVPVGNCRHSTDGSVTDSSRDGRGRKEREVAAAKVQLAECQRTILVLGNHLRALTSSHEPLVDTSYDPSASATSADYRHLQLGQLDDGQVDVASPRHASLRRARPGFVRTRGGRLISAEQFWGSSGHVMNPQEQFYQQQQQPMQATPHSPGAASYSFSRRHVLAPPPDYFTASGALCLQSPLHEYVTDTAMYGGYSPPETAMSSPAGSPARFGVQLEQARQRAAAASPPASGVRTSLIKSMNRAAAASSPSPSSKSATSRIARFFSRAKKASPNP